MIDKRATIRARSQDMMHNAMLLQNAIDAGLDAGELARIAGEIAWDIHYVDRLVKLLAKEEQGS